jgi:hypothetical protein
MSSDGHYQTAVAGAQGTPCTGNIYVSTDYGVNWTAKAPVVGVWTGIAMSSDGRYQTATPFDGSTYNSRIQLYVSSDYGQNWQPKATVKAWTTVAMSSTGQYQLAGADSNGVYLSTDFGNTWTQTSLPTSGVFWESQLGVSGDGKYMVADPSAYSALYVSSDYGVTWTQKSITDEYTVGSTVGSVGRHMTAYTYYQSGTGHWTSRDYGATWINRGSPSSGIVSMSSSEQKQLGNGYSNDFGITWTTASPAGFSGTAMSSTGQYQTGVTLYGQIWRSANYGGDNNGYGSANRIINGACGTAAKTYISTASSFGSDTMCSAGNGVTTPSTVTFPTGGTPATWTCGGSNGGNQSGACTATKNRKATIGNGTMTYSVNTSAKVTFTGFSASDEDGDTLTYAWVCTNGTFTNNGVANPEYIAPATAGTDSCTLVVSDTHELTTSSAVTVTVTTPTAGVCGSANGHRFLSTDTGYAAAGKPQCSSGTPTVTTFPTGGTPATWYCANSGINSPQCSATRNRKATIGNGTMTYSVNTSAKVTFTGFSASDADSDTLTYAWVCTNGTFTSNAVLNPEYIAPATAGTDTCTLVLSDQHELTTSSSVTVTVNATPAGICGSANGRTFLSTESSYGSYPQCSLGNSTATAFPTGGTPATWYCANSGINSPQCSATKNRLPAITNGTTTYSAVTSATVTFTGFLASDADSDTLTYAWSCTNGGTFNSSAIVNPTYIAPATVRTDTCTLSVNDTHETVASSAVTVNVMSPNVNGACGTANGRITSTAPTNPPVPNTTPNPLCAVGTASAFTSTSPWKWTCAGSGSGTTASCSTTPLPQWQNN